ncbi:MAG: RNA polymerase sigma factor [Ferrimicrobium sp.]
MTSADSNDSKDAAEFNATLQKAKRGEEDSIAILWRSYNPEVVRFLKATSTRDADDIAQEIWISLARALPDFDGDERRFRLLLFKIAKRRMTDSLRRRYRERATIDAFAAQNTQSPSAPNDPYVAIEGLEHALALLAQLPALQAQVVALRTVVGLSSAEIAEIVNRSEGAVRVLAHRGLRHLNSLVQRNVAPPADANSSTSTPLQRAAAIAAWNDDEHGNQTR